MQVYILLSLMHQFHIPVLGLSFSIDTPLKVARFGISSVMSLSSDALLEDMRAHHSQKNALPYEPISEKEEDYRARRITAYLDLIDVLIKAQIDVLRSASLDQSSPLTEYLNLLPSNNPLKIWYQQYEAAETITARRSLNELIKNGIKAGSADVNIMTKVNKTNYDQNKNPLGDEFADALAALRGFAHSTLESAVVFSAGFNPRLYSYLEKFNGFFPNAQGIIAKKVILKVSDYRSAVIQGKFLAKKGIWISEFRIESGLNCGGHAFPTEGLLAGPILSDFKNNRQSLEQELHELCLKVWEQKGLDTKNFKPHFKITIQGGIGTADEQHFLMDHYGIEGTGWGTPFLLVPEATTVDDATLKKLAQAKSKDLYLSKTSPLGVPFNNLKDTPSEQLRLERIAKNRPGSPCHKKYLVSNAEFSKAPICTASRKYQSKKLKELDSQNLPESEYQKAYEDITVKACLCEDLSASAYLKNDLKPQLTTATAICPGPNLAFFSRQYSLKEMVGHIYGHGPQVSTNSRPHVFINELKIYMEYLEGEWQQWRDQLNARQNKYLTSFKANLEKGIDYYKNLSSEITLPSFTTDLSKLAQSLENIGPSKPAIT